MENDKYIGRLLDNRYEILEVIGSGGMAVVYKARCHRLNRLVAVKILKDDNLEDEDFRRRFHAESQAVAMLSHPNIVSIYDVSTSVMADYIVMELCEGITLKQYMEKKGILNWKETLHFAMQIAKALEHAHSKGIVHRDIKPHNVMVLKNGSVKVMDFGIARLISRGNTLTKEALGSVHYISPEQARGGRVDDRSDIYSLGVVMYEMMAGRPPYDGESPVAVAIQHINGGASLPSVLNPNIPGGLEQIIMKAMAHSISNRYPSATRMLADMDEFRKDPTILFDYTGLPIDAATRVQPSPLVMQPLRNAAPDAAVPEQPPVKRPVTQLPPNERRRQDPPQRPPQSKSRRRPNPEEEKRSRITLIAIISCSLVAVAAIGILLWLLLSDSVQPAKKQYEIPDLVGFKYEELVSMGDLENFVIEPKYEYSDTIGEGLIISQAPDAGAITEKNIMIITVSKGQEKKPITLTDLSGRTEEEACNYLQGLSINYTITERKNSNQFKKGQVISYEPKTAYPGDTVSLVISLGSTKITPIPGGAVPGKPEAEIIKLLESQGMDWDVQPIPEPSLTVAEGIVLRIEPVAGTAHPSGEPVKVYISSGIDKKIIPDLVNKQKDEVFVLMADLGFINEPTVVEVPSDQEKGTVLSQSLEKDKEHLITEQLEIQVSDGSLVPVKQDVIIDLRGYAMVNGCHVEVKRGDQVLCSGDLPATVSSVVLFDEVGLGTVSYTVTINHGVATFNQEVSFAHND